MRDYRSPIAFPAVVSLLAADDAVLIQPYGATMRTPPVFLIFPYHICYASTIDYLYTLYNGTGYLSSPHYRVHRSPVTAWQQADVFLSAFENPALYHALHVAGRTDNARTGYQRVAVPRETVPRWSAVGNVLERDRVDCHSCNHYALLKNNRLRFCLCLDSCALRTGSVVPSIFLFRSCIHPDTCTKSTDTSAVLRLCVLGVSQA